MVPSGLQGDASKIAAQGAGARPGARLLRRSARLVAIAFLLPAVVRPCLSLRPWSDALVCASVFALAGLAVLLLATLVWDQVLLRGQLGAQVKQGNLAAGIAGAAHVLGSGIVAAHCLAGEDLTALPVSLLFFVIAQVSLIALVLLFRCLTYYADDQEIVGENPAAAISYAGMVIALSIIVGHAADGSFLGWAHALRAFGLSLLLCLALYPVRQIVVARLFLGFPLVWRGGALDRAIAQDRDLVVSIIEALGALAAAWLATGLA
jgi:uncharacterized membrane protein YjfL (UPF0719 family)